MTGDKKKDMVTSNQTRALGLFSNREDAEQALTELKSSGFPMDKVSVVAREAGESVGDTQTSTQVGDKNLDTGSAVVGETLTNSALASFLVGLGSLAIPGIGPMIAAGTFGASLVATVASTGVAAANFGGVVKALTDLGIPEETARIYTDRLRAGDYLVVVDGAEDDISRAQGIFSSRGIQNWGVF
ncbi:hypothetical protein MicvaDRAFT_3512 [Microcoleus vaginatus FGP-2]|nr:hypothetical protein MicvaDRAFT_3512 [Microcoleus vaginatus FGP-2]